MEIQNHLLKGPGIKFVETPNHSGPFGQNYPDTIIIHFTAGSSAESTVNVLTNPATKASAHIVVGRDGSMTQLAPFNIITWHAGLSEYEGRTGFNQYSIGIEIDNAGLLSKRADGYYSWFNRRYPESEVVKAVHRNEFVESYWHAYTEEQINKVYELCALLKEQYNIQLILGHEEISPNRKIDPGPAFPLDKLRDKVLNSARDEDGKEQPEDKKEALVIASSLNIRSAPSASADRIALPLPNGTKVKIIESADGWSKVQTVIEGWVDSRFIK